MGDFWSDLFGGGGGSKGGGSGSGGGKSGGAGDFWSGVFGGGGSKGGSGSGGEKLGGGDKSSSGFSRTGFLKGLLKGSPSGTKATVQTQRDVEKAHPHKGGHGPHHDAHAGTVREDGSVKVTKIHSDDKAK